MKKKHYLFVLVVLGSFLPSIKAQNTTVNQGNPTSGLDLLTWNNDIQTTGYGDASVGHWNSENTGIDNPAKITSNISDSFYGFNYSNYMPGITNDMKLISLIGVWAYDKRVSLGLNFNYFQTGLLRSTDANANATGNYSSNIWNVSLRAALALSERSSLGLSIGHVTSNSFDPQASKIGVVAMNQTSRLMVDIGYFHSTKQFNFNDRSTQYYFEGHRGEKFVSWGVSICNIGQKLGQNSQLFYGNFMPTRLKMGISYNNYVANGQRLSLIFQASKLLVPTPPIISTSGKISKGFDSSEMNSIDAIFSSFADAPNGFKEELQETVISSGLEYAYQDIMILRGGITSENKLKGDRKYLTTGLGIRATSNIDINLCYMIPFGSSVALANTLRIGINFRP
jgi:hypothetical protein